MLVEPKYCAKEVIGHPNHPLTLGCGIYIYIYTFYHRNQANVGKYIYIYHTWILAGRDIVSLFQFQRFRHHNSRPVRWGPLGP